MNDKGKCRDCPLKENCDEYKKVLTNEEWFDTLSTEEKAKVLNDIFWKYTNYVDEHEMVDDDITEFYLCWLKEKHHEHMWKK